MNVKVAEGAVIRFQGWEIRPTERQLLVRGSLVSVGSRAFDLLRALVDADGDVVRKDQLLDLAWKGLVVEENNVSVQIANLRKILGPTTISTVPGIGYRLAASRRTANGAGAAAGIAGAESPRVAEESLVGREDDLLALDRLASSARLLSITGTGGVGKTSLARVVVARLRSPAWNPKRWIDLSPIRSAAQMLRLVAQSLDVDAGDVDRSTDDLLSTLVVRQELLVLDNCEHLIADVASFVQQALDRAKGLRWLVTSQEPLRLAEERVYRLGPLSVPPPNADLDEALLHGATALLRRCTSAADRSFDLNQGNLAVAIDICRQLDGLPLAIEMAAARVASLGLNSVRDQLGRRLLLTGRRDAPARQHTLRSTFDWSYELLSTDEKRVFRRLEPFLGGFTVALASQVTSDAAVPSDRDDWRGIEALGTLIEKSLVHRQPGTDDRYFLFEGARDYAASRLEEAGERSAVRRRHAHVVADTFEPADVDYTRLGDDAWAARYLGEHHNVRVAFDWACGEGEPDLLARLVAALGQLDYFVQAASEIIRDGVSMDTLADAAPRHRALAYLELSWAHYADGNRELGTTLARQALSDFRAAGDVAHEYRALAQLARLYESRPGMEQEAEATWVALLGLDEQSVPLRTRLHCTIAHRLFHRALRTLPDLRDVEQTARRSGFLTLAAVCRVHLTDQALIESRFDDTIEFAHRFLAEGEPRPRLRALLLINQMLALVQTGRVDAARHAASEAMQAFPQAAHYVAVAFALANSRVGNLVDAALIHGYAHRAWAERGSRSDAAEATAMTETAARLSASLSSERLAELMAVGAALSRSEMLAIALAA